MSSSDIRAPRLDQCVAGNFRRVPAIHDGAADLAFRLVLVGGRQPSHCPLVHRSAVRTLKLACTTGFPSLYHVRYPCPNSVASTFCRWKPCSSIVRNQLITTVVIAANDRGVTVTGRRSSSSRYCTRSPGCRVPAGGCRGRLAGSG